MKYKFDLHPAIKGLAEWQLENYRKEKNILQEIESDQIRLPISNYGVYGGARTNNIDSRPTESAAIRILTDPYIQRMWAGVNAVEKALNGADQSEIKLISLVYWTKTNNVEGASVICNMSKSNAYRRINEILARIAYEMGYLKLT